MAVNALFMSNRDVYKSPRFEDNCDAEDFEENREFDLCILRRRKTLFGWTEVDLEDC